MASNATPNDVKDMALPTAATLLAVLGAILVVPGYPIASASATASGAVLGLVQSVIDRRARRQRGRFERIVQDVQERVEDLEQQVRSDEQVDLFVEVLEKAIKDDEDAKERIYVGVLEWMLRQKPTLAQVRILSNAVRELSYLELYCFIAEMAGKPRKRLYEPLISERVFWNRLTQAGLTEGASIRKDGNPTQFGETLAEYCPFDGLAEPKEDEAEG